MEPEGSLPHSQESAATCPYPKNRPGPRLCWMIRNLVIFYGEEC
jgi:hypothetical protein